MSKTSLAQETRANKTERKKKKKKIKKKKSHFIGNLYHFFLPTECMMSNFFANAKSPQKVTWSNTEVLCFQYNEMSLV